MGVENLVTLSLNKPGILLYCNIKYNSFSKFNIAEKLYNSDKHCSIKRLIANFGCL
jgi:hypothetical protein